MIWIINLFASHQPANPSRLIRPLRPRGVPRVQPESGLLHRLDLGRSCVGGILPPLIIRKRLYGFGGHPKLLRNLGTNRFCATPFRLNLRWWFFRHQAAELVGDSLVGDPVFQSGWRFAAYPNLLRLRGNIVERGHGKETRLCSKHKRPICEVAKHTWI